MSDIPDWEKKYWQQKMQQKMQNLKSSPQNLPHYEPAHISNEKEKFAQTNSSQWKDVDVTLFMHNSNHNDSQAITLREGVLYYRSVNSENFGSTMTMVRNCGPLSNILDRQFIKKGERQCYLIDNLQVVDLSNIDNNKLVNLIEVSAPFIGTILVPKSAIIESTNSGPKLLKG